MEFQGVASGLAWWNGFSTAWKITQCIRKRSGPIGSYPYQLLVFLGSFLSCSMDCWTGVSLCELARSLKCSFEAVGWSNKFHVADGSWSGWMVEGPVDSVRVMGLEDVPPQFWCGFQTDRSIWSIVLLSLECHAQILLECSLWHWFELPIRLPYFLTFGNKFGIKYFTWCLVWRMHAWYEKYEITCYAQKCVTDHDLMHTQ